MKKILLVCSAGMSTSMLVKKMQAAATDRQLDVEILAVAESEAKNHTDAGVVLLGPQVRFIKAKVEKLMGGAAPVEIINSVHYGTLNGEKVLDTALDLMG